MWMMAAGAAMSVAKGMAQGRANKKYAKKLQIANNLQAAADQKVINTQSSQMSQQAAQARRGLSIKHAQQEASNEARNAATGGAMGGSVDRTAAVLDLASSRMDQEIQTNLANQLYQQELNKLVNSAASANAQAPKGANLLDLVLAGTEGALQFYR